jgi:hypothetical protein
MNKNSLSLDELCKLVNLFSSQESPSENSAQPEIEAENPLLGKYVIVRCKDAGVHAGVLESAHARECVLTDARRLWYWKPAIGKWLSAVANHGLHEESKISETVTRIVLTENCELIQTSSEAEKSIRNIRSDA